MSLFNRLSRVAFQESVQSIRPILSRSRSISFSQYAEDLLFYHMQPQYEGFYVDVGAFHPHVHSNTYKFYLKGWRGVTVEPNPDIAPAFNSTRPRDTHLTIGIAAAASHLTYYRFEDAHRNTFDADFVSHVSSPRRGEVHVPCVPLSAVFDEHCAGKQVDLISIDCENRDLEVAASLDWSRHRPTVVVIEDFEQFDSGANAAVPPSAIRSFFASRDYALAAQAFFSSIYVNRHGFAATGRKAGFRLDQTQFSALAI